jgi:hypothetical protein
MWFTGRVSGAATVLVLDPSQVTALPETGAFGTDVRVAVLPPSADLPPEEPEEADEPVEPVEPADADEPVEPAELAPASDATAVEDEPLDVLFAAPSSWTPVPSLHAVRESAARTAVAAAAARRVREVRRLDMSAVPLRSSSCRGDWMTEACEVIRPNRHAQRGVGDAGTPKRALTRENTGALERGNGMTG